MILPTTKEPVKKLVPLVLSLVFLGTACGNGDADTVAAVRAVPTTATTETPTTTTTETPTTTTTLPAPPTFVLLCPAEASFGYFGKPTMFTLGYQGYVGTDVMALDVSWGDGKAARYASLAAFGKRRSHDYGPGIYQVSALLTDDYGRTATSSCTVKWTDTLPGTMNAFHCVMTGGWDRAPDGSYQKDPSCA
jgi:hypothetical protein